MTKHRAVDDREQIGLVAGKALRYRVRRSPRAKRPSLHVTHDEGLIVVVPRRWALAEVGPLLRENAAWIDGQVERYGVRNGPRRRELVTGSEILLLGRARRLVLEVREGATRVTLRLVDDADELRLAGPPAAFLDVRAVLVRALKRVAREHLARRARELAPRVGAAPRRLIVGERRSRWGSCSPSGNLSFCYRLVMAPPAVIDALVLHELCHLRQMNHGPAFYRLFDRVCPGHRELRRWLIEHEGELHL